MSKITKRFKNKKNRTMKSRAAFLIKGGDSSENKKNETFEKEEREGIFDIIGNKINDVVSSAATNVGDAGLKIVGLERVNKSDEEEENDTKKVDENIEKIGNVASEIVSDVENVVDKTGAAIIENVNEVLGSDVVKETTKQAAEETANIVKESAETFNEALNDPEVKAEIEEAIENAGEVGAIAVKAAEKPFNEAVDVAAKAIPKATGATLAGLIKVGTDAMAAIPGVGGIIEIGKIINDSSRAASAVVEAGSEAAEVASDAFIETKENIDKALDELEKKKKLAEQVSSRTSNSIKEFENPKKLQLGGVHKTRRRLTKRKSKSKRVRFSI